MWLNMGNPYISRILSLLALAILVSQPFFSLMTINNTGVRVPMVWTYLFCTIVFIAIKWVRDKNVFNKFNIHKSRMGHLRWNFILNQEHSSLDMAVFLIWLFFFVFGFFYNGNNSGIILGSILLFITYYQYMKDGSFGSMWCWSVNGIMIILAAYLLIVLPFWEKNKMLI
jgi:hypothetical protein